MSLRHAHRIDPADFHPDPRRAELLDQRMRMRLVASVRHVVKQSKPHLMAPDTLPLALDRIRQGPVSPLVFGAYFDMVVAVSRDDLVAAQSCLAEIAAASCVKRGIRIIEFTDPRMDLAADRYQRLVDTDPESPLSFGCPSNADAHACRASIDAAFALLRPPLGAEIRALLREIVLVAPSGDAPSSIAFDGASSFMLWGAILLNAVCKRTRLDMAQALVHESGHNLLFGFCARGALVENDDDARYASPLRDDPRPMDGIVHATYVVARMHYALDRLLHSNALTPGEVAQARDAMGMHAASFADGLATISKFGQLTALGAAVTEGARRHMAPS